MALKNASDKISEETSSVAADVASAATSNTAHLNAQVEQLKEMVNTLALAFQDSLTRSSQNAAFLEATSEIRQAARSMAAGAAAVLPAVAAPRPHESGGCGCECSSEECCAFDIVLCKVRATRPQIEPPDAGDIPLAQNAMEVRIYVTANKSGVLIPSLASTLDLRADGIPPGPGPWVIIERVINRVHVRKGATQVVNLHVEVEEDDTRLTEQAALAGKNEYGETTGTISVNCCMQEIYPPMPLDVDLRYGGEGRGAVQVVVCARRVCC